MRPVRSDEPGLQADQEEAVERWRKAKVALRLIEEGRSVPEVATLLECHHAGGVFKKFRVRVGKASLASARHHCPRPSAGPDGPAVTFI